MSVVTVDLNDLVGVSLDTRERGESRCRELELDGDEILVLNFFDDAAVTAEYLAGLLSAHARRFGESTVDYVEFVNPNHDHMDVINELTMLLA